MQLTRALPALGALMIVAAVACSDSGTLQPDAPRTTLGTSGQTDTAKSPPTTNPNPPQTGPDTTGSQKPSTDPRSVTGTVIGMGPASDSTNYQKVAAATLVVTSVEGKELARVVTSADGSFSLGSFKPGTYMITVTPPADGPYKGTQWLFIIGDYSPAKVDLTVWLGRK